ncbi:MAG: hypothetical protein IKU00_09440 [Bacteroidales bacterium]|nr:hypothetical protein [Bacteroidales bacterium]
MHSSIYDSYTAAAYYEAVANHDAKSVEAAYYLLKRRLSRALKAVYEVYGVGMADGFDDTVEDFFLYLHDGNAVHDAKPFAMLEGVRNKGAFFAWVLGTYRRFLLNKAKEEARRRALLEHARLLSKEEERLYPEETLIRFLTTAIAYADQQFVTRNRFILYRLLLSFLDHGKAIPQEAMARALGMQPVTYRVCTKRQKDRLLGLILLQETGQTLDLDFDHAAMRDKMSDGFDRIYELLLERYGATLNDLPAAGTIMELRCQSGHGDASSVFEQRPRYGYGNTMDVKVLYPSLIRFLSTD